MNLVPSASTGRCCETHFRATVRVVLVFFFHIVFCADLPELPFSFSATQKKETKTITTAHETWRARCEDDFFLRVTREKITCATCAWGWCSVYRNAVTFRNAALMPFNVSILPRAVSCKSVRTCCVMSVFSHPYQRDSRQDQMYEAEH